MLKKNKLLLVLFLVLIQTTVSSASDIIIKGAGATFPHKLYKKWFEEYEKSTGIRVTYEGIGSGKGVKKLLSQEVDFGASDIFLKDDYLKKSNQEILQIPTCLGAVSVVYNLHGNKELKFTPELLSDIFMGHITKWNDPKLLKLNPSLSQTDLRINCIHRSESSGTTFIFSDFLTKTSKEWAKKMGKGKKIKWTSGMGVEGNSGIANLVRKIPGSIGYMEFSQAQSKQLPSAAIKNKSGQFVSPTLESIRKAGEANLPDDLRLMITNTETADAYPLSSFSYILFFKDQNYSKRTSREFIELKKLIQWALSEGQKLNESLQYGKLPPEAQKKALTILNKITYKGKETK